MGLKHYFKSKNNRQKLNLYLIMGSIILVLTGFINDLTFEPRYYTHNYTNTEKIAEILSNILSFIFLCLTWIASYTYGLMRNDSRTNK